MKPLVAVNLEVTDEEIAKVRVNRLYLESVQKPGAIPLLIPPMTDADLRSQISHASGFLFIGGRDYPASLYGQTAHPTLDPLNPDRVALDWKLMKLALKATDRKGQPKPILAICGGHQLLNISLGGTLIQDIESHLPGHGVLHKSKVHSVATRARHAVKLVAGTQIAKVYGAGTVSDITSSHHQVVGRLGKGLVISGFSEDGFVEAVEHASRPFTIGVQWHPEVDYDINRKLFAAFIRRCKQMDV